MKLYRILLIENNSDAVWVSALKKAMSGSARISLMKLKDMIKQPLRMNFDLFLIHAASVPDMVQVIQDLKKKKETPIVVVTSVPSPEVARSVFLAGAADYIDQSVNEAEIRHDLLSTLERFKKE